MNLSKDYQLKLKIEEFKKETGLSDDEVKKLFIKTYLLEGEEEKTPDEMMSEFLHPGLRK